MDNSDSPDVTRIIICVCVHDMSEKTSSLVELACVTCLIVLLVL